MNWSLSSNPTFQRFTVYEIWKQKINAMIRLNHHWPVKCQTIKQSQHSTELSYKGKIINQQDNREQSILSAATFIQQSIPVYTSRAKTPTSLQMNLKICSSVRRTEIEPQKKQKTDDTFAQEKPYLVKCLLSSCTCISVLLKSFSSFLMAAYKDTPEARCTQCKRQRHSR